MFLLCVEKNSLWKHVSHESSDNGTKYMKISEIHEEHKSIDIIPLEEYKLGLGRGWVVNMLPKTSLPQKFSSNT